MILRKGGKGQIMPEDIASLVSKKKSKKHDARSRKKENVILLGLSFLFSITLAITIVLCLLQVTVFDQGFLRRQIERSRYPENIMNEVQVTLSSFGMGSGFSEGFFAEAVSQDMLTADIFREISRIYEDSRQRVVAGNRFNENLRAELTAYVEVQTGMQNTDEVLTYDQQYAINNLADISTAAYVNIVSIPFTDQFFSVMSHLRRISAWGLAVFILLDVVCILVVLLTNKRIVSRRDKVECLMNATAGAVLIIGIPAIWLAGSGVLRRISVSGQALYQLMQQYIASTFQIVWIMLGILAVIWLCGLLYRQAYLLSKESGREFSL
jgi:hypothetical protein